MAAPEDVWALTPYTSGPAFFAATGQERWKVWGPKGVTLPTGRFPTKIAPPMWMWTFREWARKGEVAGCAVEPLQCPLYYQIKLKKIMDAEWRIPGSLCTKPGCRKRRDVCGVMVAAYGGRLDLCFEHVVNFFRRGLLEPRLARRLESAPPRFRRLALERECPAA